MEDGRQSPKLHLNLNNFEGCCAGSRYVLTSPRSLEACARLGVRPVDLLHKSYGEVREENPGARSLEVSDLYETQEKRRLGKLRQCRELRNQLLEDDYKKPQRDPTEHPTTASAKWGPQNTPSKGHIKGGDTLRRSHSQGDLVRPELEVRQLARQVEKEIGFSVPHRDKKIAALMLLKHQEEEQSKQRRLQAEQAWEELRAKEAAIRDAISKKDSSARLQNRRRNARGFKLGPAHQNLMPGHKMLLKDGSGKAKCQQIHFQEETDGGDINSGDVSGSPLEERMLHAISAKMMKDFQNKKNIQVKNEYEKLRHSRLKDEVDSQVRAEEHERRLYLQQKERRFRALYDQALEERGKDLQEKATREEEQILLAKIRAEQQEKEQVKHKKALAQITDQKMKQATDSLGRSVKNKAERVREVNFFKERTHHLLRQRIQEEEANHRREMAQCIRIKDQKSDRLLKGKEAAIERGRKIARASFHMRDKIREQTKSRTFDQMALQAQLNASLMKPVP